MAIFVPLFDNDSISGQDVFRYIKRNIQVLSDHPDHRRELAPIFRRGAAYRQFFISLFVSLFVHVPGKIHKPVSARSILSAGRRAGSRCCRALLADGCLITPDGPRLSGVAAVECLRHGGGGPGIKNKNQNPGESGNQELRKSGKGGGEEHRQGEEGTGEANGAKGAREAGEAGGQRGAEGQEGQEGLERQERGKPGGRKERRRHKGKMPHAFPLRASAPVSPCPRTDRIFPQEERPLPECGARRLRKRPRPVPCAGGRGNRTVRSSGNSRRGRSEQSGDRSGAKNTPKPPGSFDPGGFFRADGGRAFRRPFGQSPGMPSRPSRRFAGTSAAPAEEPPVSSGYPRQLGVTIQWYWLKWPIHRSSTRSRPSKVRRSASSSSIRSSASSR